MRNEGKKLKIKVMSHKSRRGREYREEQIFELFMFNNDDS